MKTLSSLMYLVILFTFSSKLYSWENKFTHPAITNNSIAASVADNYLKTQLGISGGLSTQLYWDFPSDIETRMTTKDKVEPTKTKTVLDWLRAGSAIEDEDGKWIPWRPRHHFYDPTRNAGLDNHTAHPEWDGPGTSSWLPLGASALDWAIDGYSSYEPHNNHDKWTTARNIFYDALTAQSQSGREAYLAESLLKLGCVLHLLEDMGVPAHTRNDFLYGHYRSIYKWDWGNDLEKDVEARITANGGNSLWSGSSAVAFDKLTKYFDTGTRYDLGADDYLGNGNTPPNTWGLSEATNYQFMSLSTVFGSYLLKYYFPHPNMAYMSTPITESYPLGSKRYFNGVNYGVSHMARESYTYYKIYYNYTTSNLTPQTIKKVDSTITTDDENVFDDYAEITIPRTINYATGLANYFFRGKLSATAEYIDCNTIELAITNLSDNSGTSQNLKGGEFELYWDDTAGNRTPITSFVIDGGWTSSSTLAYNEQKTITFIKPSGAIEKFVIIYKGNICQNPADLDSDDSDALAVAIIENSGCPFASDDCGCFLDPNTPTWNSSTTYNAGDLVEYSYYGTYKSNADNNINHTPSNATWWTKVSNAVSNDNENWDAYPPFGGIGKTPKYIAVTFSDLVLNRFCGGEFDCGNEDTPCDESDVPTWSSNPNRTFVLPKTGQYTWSCTEPYPTTLGETFWSIEVVIDNQHGYIQIYLFLNHYNSEVEEWADSHYYNEDDLVVGTYGGLYECKVAHTSSSNDRPITGVTENVWETSHYYSIGDLVLGTNGYTYRCKSAHTSNIDRRPVTGGYWSSYWEIAGWRKYWELNNNKWDGGGICGCLVFYNDGKNNSDESCWAEIESNGSKLVGVGHTVLASMDSFSWQGSSYYYLEGNLVFLEGTTFKCIHEHFGTDDKKPTTGANWEDYWVLWDTPINVLSDPQFICKSEYTAKEMYYYEWLTGTPYATGNKRRGKDRNTYTCIKDATTNVWVTGHYYSIGDLVLGTDGSTYKCETTHTSGNTTRPVSGGSWGTYWDVVVHISATSNEPRFGVDWEDYWSLTDVYTEPGIGEAWETYWDLIFPCKDVFEKTFKNSCSFVYQTTTNPPCQAGQCTLSPYVPTPELWLADIDYVSGDMVIGSNSEIYVCNTAHTSTINDEPITGASWQDYWNLAGCCGE